MPSTTFPPVGLTSYAGSTTVPTRVREDELLHMLVECILVQEARYR
jgi:hypothetical protein